MRHTRCAVVFAALCLTWTAPGLAQVPDHLKCYTDFNNPQDVDNTYTWTSSGLAADGTAFTNYLSALNACTDVGSGTGFLGFAGHCDWRLPTRQELRTIVDCSFGSPCISPVFGPTAASRYWSKTTDNSVGSSAWDIDFTNGTSFNGTKFNAFHVRAVRGGSADFITVP